MIKLIKFTILIIIFSSLLGPSVKLPLDLPPINVYLPDVFIFLLFLLIALNYRQTVKIVKNDKPAKILGIFFAYSLITLIFTPINLTRFEFLVSLLYLLRFCLYFSLYIGCLYLIKAKNGKNLSLYLNLSAILFIILGWMQYFLYPDLRNLEYLGWDPHYGRIFALIFDPNYLGLIIVMGFLVRHTMRKLNFKELAIQLIFLTTVMFTYSRSSYLALISAVLYYALKIKKFVSYLVISLAVVLSLLLLPRSGGASVQLERLFSIQERLSNWQSAAYIITTHPYFGVGFNTLRFARRAIGNLPENWLTSHSAAGVDNSFLFLAATTGIIGLVIFLYLLISIFKQSDLTGKVTVIAVCVHSFFLNSLFFNFILIWFWSILALTKKEK